jgi:phosphoglycerate dehydrogenase-like enzyme
MSKVICLRPEKDFTDVGVIVPKSMEVLYLSPDDKNLKEALKEADALVVPAVGKPIDSSLLENSKCKFIQVTGAGVDRLNRAAIEKLGIAVANVAGGSNDTIAQYCVGAAIALLRAMPLSSQTMHHKNYNEIRSQLLKERRRDITGLKVGILGFGNIGKAVAKAFDFFGAKVCFFDPLISNNYAGEDFHAIRLPFDQLLKDADILSVHVPLMPETMNLLDSHSLASMKDDAVLINPSRGGILDEAAMAELLLKNKFQGLAIDVYQQEPPDSSNPLLLLPDECKQRIIFTPHIAGISSQSWASLFNLAWQNVERVIVTKNDPENRVY